jgi:hypothetical protein
VSVLIRDKLEIESVDVPVANVAAGTANINDASQIRE